MPHQVPDAVAPVEMKSDVQTAAIEPSADTPNGLQEVYEALVTKAESAMAWYETRQRSKRRAARYIRTAAILLGALTAIIPSIIAMFPDRVSFFGLSDFPVIRLNPIATITGVAAGTAILFDRFYGFSSSWIRFITTYQEIENNLEEFRIGWRKQVMKLNSNNPATDEQIIAVYDFLAAFLKAVNDSVRNETMGWVNEFKGALGDIEKNVDAQRAGAVVAAPAPKGAIRVVIVDNDSLDDSRWTLQLDNRKEEVKLGQSSASIALLEPGIYKLRIAGTRKQRPVAAEYSIAVKAGEINELTVDKLG
jgi:hypothetical protein